MRVGIIGAGRWGANYAATLKKLGREAEWVCSRNETSCRQLIDRLKLKAKATANYDEMLSKTDAVIIATPGSTHYEMARKALEAGKHVLVEKPMTLNSNEAEDLVKIAERNNLILMAGHIHRYNPGVQKIKELIDSGALGKVKGVKITTTNNGPLRDDVNALWDMMPHDITIASCLLGRYPESVSAKGEARLKKGREDIITATMKFGNVPVESYASWISQKKQRLIEVAGEKASLNYDDGGKKLTLEENGKGRQIKFDRTLPLELELEHFVECVKSRKKPKSDGKDGLKNVAVLEAMQESMRKGKEVRV